MDIQHRINQSKTKLVKVVFPNTTNHHHTLFGGMAMQWMDEAAFIAATRFCRKKVVTISTDKIDFTEPIPADTIIEIEAEVVRVGNTSLQVAVTIFQEDMYKEDTKRKSIYGKFTFVALNNINQPTQVL